MGNKKKKHILEKSADEALTETIGGEEKAETADSTEEILQMDEAVCEESAEETAQDIPEEKADDQSGMREEKAHKEASPLISENM